jgi:rare lipoprotein A
MYQLTAAHRTLPLGTWLQVTNLDNGRSVVVRVNDRGPVPRTRVIDLSYEAATLLGMRPQGVQQVRLDVVPAPPVVASSQNGTYGQSLQSGR